MYKRLSFVWASLIIALILFSPIVKGQSLTPTDTLKNSEVKTQLSSLERLTAERLADSLKKAELINQANIIHQGNTIQKSAILAELKLLKERDSLRLRQQQFKIDSLRNFIKGTPVVLLTDTLFYFYASAGSISAKERAETLQAKIKEISKLYPYTDKDFTISAQGSGYVLFHKKDLLINISELDGLWMHKTPLQTAELYKSKIIEGIARYKHETSISTIAKEIALALVVIFVAILLIKGANKLFRWLTIKLTVLLNRFMRGIHIKQYEFLNSSQQKTILNGVLTLAKWWVYILIIYTALPIIFGIFPFTKQLSKLLISYVTDPLKRIGIAIWNYIPNLITILVLVLLFRYLIRGLKYLKNEIAHERLNIPGFYADWANSTFQIIRVLIWAFGLIVIFPYLPGSDSPIFKGVSVFMGVLFTFGSAGALSNLVAGLILTYMRAFKLGDRVEIGGVNGDVIEKTLLVTRIRTIKNEVISIPNSTVMNNHTVNYSSDAPQLGLILHTTVTIGYDVPWKKVEGMLIAAALRTQYIESAPSPFVLQTGLQDFYVEYQINAYTKEPNKQASIYSELHAHIQDCFFEAGVEIMSPHYSTIRDGNQVAMPPEYLPKDYNAPEFSVSMKQGYKKEE